MEFSLFFIRFGSILILMIPLFIVSYIQYSKGRTRHIIVQFNNPQTGTTVRGRVKIGFSWTILFFGWAALLFRSQWMEFFIWIILFIVFGILVSYATSSALQEVNSLYNNFLIESINDLDEHNLLLTSDGTSVDITGWITGNTINVEDIGTKYQEQIVNHVLELHPNLSGELYSEFFNNMSAWAWTLYALSIVSQAITRAIFVLFGNKWRLRKMYDRYPTMTFDLPENQNPDDIYKYINAQRRGEINEELRPGVVQGQTHQYVVPDEQIDEPEEDYDYSSLTVQDLKLLLKTEGIPFDATSTKEELLELVEENIAKKQREDYKLKNGKYIDSKYSNMTVQELVEELDKRKIKYTSTMRKPDLVKLLVDEPEEEHDYSSLTVQDLKLLLKTEGIPFDATSTKEELLELVEENIAKNQSKDQELINEEYANSKYYNMTVQELIEELDKRKIKYTSTMRKPDLVKLLVDNDEK